MTAGRSKKKIEFDTVALLLQGGGALGSYQAGVVEGLVAAGIEPDWVAGISIGALNTAVIAGNPPQTRVQRLREFWETICRPAAYLPPVEAMQRLIERATPEQRKVFSGFEAWRAIVEGQREFFVPRGLTPWLGGKQGIAQASFYDTSQLRGTLQRYADFDRINEGAMRVSIGAVNVRNGNFVYFDNTSGPARKARKRGPSAPTRSGVSASERPGALTVDHFMASAALPPGFPAVQIGDDHYWDGGLVSNTPLSHVLQATPRRNTLAFQVDLWSALGRLPDNVYDVEERRKDIQYSSRTRAVTDAMARAQHHRRLLREVLEHVPAKARDDPWVRRAMELACERQYSVIHLIYQEKEWEGLAKDYEFSPQAMREHWASGLLDIERTLGNESWLRLPPEGREFVTHDCHRPPP